MSIKKSLLALGAMALAMMAFASSALAVDGTLRDVEGAEEEPAAGKVTTYEGWAQFAVLGTGLKCHVRSKTEATSGTTGKVTEFTVPTTTACSAVGLGTFSGCTLETHSSTNLPYHLTVTPTDFDVTGTIVLHQKYAGATCSHRGEEDTLTFSSVTLKPLKTGTRAVTNTATHLGTAAAAGERIAGVELEASGTLHPSGGGSVGVVGKGELEVKGTDLCTWKLT